ncbi:outer membrane protein assembly factor BamB family protein [Microtetraspora niveoalba]|uniref:outer membrane protein assembly factor BamB family protein n=1 Tax=Microtetraspora niveoalba TaxID=46175 RepID=UPI0012F7202E|nr:PQQ-binding-like beta-propeller repeat protein [Microtetraspora niveoalba]
MSEQHTGDPYGDRPAPPPWGPPYAGQQGDPADPRSSHSQPGQPADGRPAYPQPGQPTGQPTGPYAAYQSPFPQPPGQSMGAEPSYPQGTADPRQTPPGQPWQPYPQQPGYPQQGVHPQQSPPQQPPYGHPQNAYPQQPPYGHPQQPYPQQVAGQAQPPYPQQTLPAYPQQAPPGYPPQPTPSRPPRGKGMTALFVALGLAVLLAVGGGTAWFVARGGSDASGDAGGAAGGGAGGTWDVPLPNANSMDFTSGFAYAGWLTDSAVVRAQRDGLLAYDLKSGSRAWGIPTPGEELCGATPELTGGKGAIAYGTAHLCDHLAGLDTATGKLTWKIKIPAEKPRLANSRLVPRIMSAGGMAVLYVGDGLYAYRLSDGRRVWGVKADLGCSFKDVNANGDQVAVLMTCYVKGQSTVVAVVDAATGKGVWSRKIGDVGLMGSVLSADPTIIRREEGDGNVFTVLDGKAGKPVEIKTGKVDMLAMNTVAFIDGVLEQRRYAVHGGRLYLATFPENVPGKLRSVNKALAFDLATGKQVWQSSGTQDTMLTYVRADDQGLLALEVGDRRDLAPRLIRLDAATGAAKEVAELPQKYGTDGERARVFERDGAVMIMPWTSVATKFAVIHVNTKED